MPYNAVVRDGKGHSIVHFVGVGGAKAYSVACLPVPLLDLLGAGCGGPQLRAGCIPSHSVRPPNKGGLADRSGETRALSYVGLKESAPLGRTKGEPTTYVVAWLMLSNLPDEVT